MTVVLPKQQPFHCPRHHSIPWHHIIAEGNRFRRDLIRIDDSQLGGGGARVSATWVKVQLEALEEIPTVLSFEDFRIAFTSLTIVRQYDQPRLKPYCCLICRCKAVNTAANNLVCQIFSLLIKPKKHLVRMLLNADINNLVIVTSSGPLGFSPSVTSAAPRSFSVTCT